MAKTPHMLGLPITYYVARHEQEDDSEYIRDMYHIASLVFYLAACNDMVTLICDTSLVISREDMNALPMKSVRIRLLLDQVVKRLTEHTPDPSWLIDPFVHLETARERLEAKTTLRSLFEKHGIDVGLIDHVFPPVLGAL